MNNPFFERYFEKHIAKTKTLLNTYDTQVLLKKDTGLTSEKILTLTEDFFLELKIFVLGFVEREQYDAINFFKECKQLAEWEKSLDVPYLDKNTKTKCLGYLYKFQLYCDVFTNTHPILDTAQCDDEVARINEAATKPLLPNPFYAAAGGPPVLNTLSKNNQAALKEIDKILMGDEDPDNKQDAVGHPSSPKRMERR